MRCKWTLVFLSAVLTVLLISSTAKADVNYTFINVTCNPVSKLMDIRVFFDWNESGKAKSTKNEKDTYYLNDIAKTGKEITCDLGDDQVVSFIARQSLDHPRNNNLAIMLNHKGISGWFPTTQQVIEIHSLASDEFSIHKCLLGIHGVKENSCDDMHIVNGKTVSHTSKKDK